VTVQEAMAQVEANPGSADAWTALGVALAAQGEARRAKESYERALKCDPNHIGAATALMLLRVPPAAPGPGLPQWLAHPTTVPAPVPFKSPPPLRMDNGRVVCPACGYANHIDRFTCSHCTTILPAVPPDSRARMRRARSMLSRFLVICILFIGVPALMFTIWQAVEDASQERDMQRYDTLAVHICQDWVRETLKAGSLPSFPDHNYSMDHQPDYKYVISSYVDIRNSRGNVIRRRWRCTLTTGYDWAARDELVIK
jgi:tetratricopeptide (TPR) repeat protein